MQSALEPVNAIYNSDTGADQQLIANTMDWEAVCGRNGHRKAAEGGKAS